VAEALQRISGIQITRNYGEGSSVAIRGLSQVQTEINGRDSFSANGGRGLSLEDIPSELLAGVDVYKDPSAEQTEGGIGGVINLRTRQPFDFKGLKVAASMGASYDDLADAARPNGSLLVSDRWDTSIGEIGVLVDASIAQTRFRQDDVSVQPFYTNVAAIGTHAIGTVAIPQGAGQDETQGSRQREGLSIALQWRPTSNLEFHSQYTRTDYYFKWNDESTFALPADGTLDATQPYTIGKSGDLTSGSFNNVPVNVNTSVIDTHSVTNDYSIGGKWSINDRLTLSADAQYIYSTNKSARFILGETGSNSAAGVTTTASEVGLNIANPVAAITLPAGYLTNPANFALGYALDHYDNDSGTEKAIRSDLEYRASEDGFIRKLKFGFRFTDRGAVTGSTPYNYDYIGQNLTSANTALYETYNYNNFFGGSSTGVGSTVVPNRSLLSNIKDTLALFGATPVAFNPSDFSTENEHTYAVYFVGDYGFKLGPFPVDGNVGVRVVNTSEDTSGYNSLTPQVLTGGTPNADGTPASTTGAPTYQAINVKQNYTDALPSFNARIHLEDNLQLRLAASKGLTRPDFSQLNPNANISQPSQTQINNNSILTAGTFGSASLKPYRTNNFDISLEWFFNKTGSLTGALFYKQVNGFIATEVDNESYYGSVFQVTRDYNQGKGTIKGAEVAYTQFLDFLPKPLDGLGVSANYTYVDSETPSPTASGTDGSPLIVPLQGLSRNSYNLVGMYEKGPIQARIAYNWRDKFIYTTAGNGTGALPVYDEAYGQLDGSISYNVNANTVLQFEVRNITNAEQDSDFGTVTRPRDAFINDRQFNAVMRVSY
jgi:TonB-dependent receptor